MRRVRQHAHLFSALPLLFQAERLPRFLRLSLRAFCRTESASQRLSVLLLRVPRWSYRFRVVFRYSVLRFSTFKEEEELIWPTSMGAGPEPFVCLRPRAVCFGLPVGVTFNHQALSQIFKGNLNLVF